VIEQALLVEVPVIVRRANARMRRQARRLLAGTIRRGSSRPVYLVSAAILALALVAGGITILRFGEQSAAEADTRLAHYADGMSADLASLFATASRDLRLARQNSTYDVALGGGADDLSSGNRTLINDSITYVADRYHVDEICLIRSTGLETARWSGGQVASVTNLSPDESGNPFFKPAMSLPADSVYVTDPYVSPDSGRWVYGFATPIILTTGARAGILHFEIPIQRLVDLATAEPFGPHAYTAVVDRSGRLLAHPDLTRYRSEAGQDTNVDTAPFPTASTTGTEAWRSLVTAALSGTADRGISTFADERGTARAAWYQVPGTSLLVFSVSPINELYADVDRTRLNLIATAGPLMLLMVVVSAWFSARLTGSNRRLAIANLKSSQLASIVESADDAILSTQPDGRIATWNEGATAMYGLSSTDVLGQRLDALFPASRASEVPRLLESVLAGEPVERYETVHQRADGTTFDVSMTFSAIHDVASTPVGVSVIARDISDHKRLEAELAHQALHDSLTGLPNRALFHDRLAQSLNRRPRPGRAVTGQHAVLFVDLDDFKIINDTLGHKTGDELLVAVAGRLRDTLRSTDTAARLGGDEFTVLIENIETESDARHAAERILDELRKPFELDGHQVVVSASIGIAFGVSGAANPDDILRAADTALYEAKGQGKGRHETYQQTMNLRAWRRLELEAELRAALTRDELDVHYQPIVDMETDQVVEVEALVRWIHPTRGVVSPGEFIPLAEQTGLIVQIGDFVIRAACRQLVEWQHQVPAAADLVLSVNVSPRELVRAGFADRVAAILVEHGLEGSRLKLEITETATLEGELANEAIRALQAYGIRVWIDDFGTGYSALGYFRHLRIDGLKIDRAFVDGLGREREDTAIVTAAIAFGRALDVDVVGEGIETPEQMARLRELGCRLGQGFLFSRPVPAAQLAKLLSRGLASHAA
jgi:diguanylate cyclase (GGDEF)-like protein/PAS domain S-box-containing protein